MEEVRADDLKRKRFLWGIALAWLPSLPFFIIGIYNGFKGIESQKATGLGAVAGGLSEVFLGFGVVGIALTFMLQIGAMFFLVRSFSDEHRTRSLVSMFSICWSALMLAYLGLFVWLFFSYMPRMGAVR